MTPQEFERAQEQIETDYLAGRIGTITYIKRMSALGLNNMEHRREDGPNKFVQDAFLMDQEELRLWREMHPREAAGVREEARAKIEKRKPAHMPPMAFG